MMDFTLTSDQKDMAAMVRALMEEKVGPRAEEIDEKAEFPVWVADLFRELDIFAVVIPEEYGGVDGSLVALCAVQEQIARIVPACSMILGVQGLGSTPVVLFGSEEQKRRWLPAFATGEKMTGFGLTEPNAGSDVKAMTTRATRVEGGWRLNGRKCFISHANIADVVVMFAKVRDDGGDRITAFLVETDQPGYTVDKIEHKMGLRGSTTCSLVLEDAWVPDENLLGEVGQGLDILLATLHKSRIGSAAQSLGRGSGCARHLRRLRAAAGAVRSSAGSHAHGAVDRRRDDRPGGGLPGVDLRRRQQVRPEGPDSGASEVLGVGQAVRRRRSHESGDRRRADHGRLRLLRRVRSGAFHARRQGFPDLRGRQRAAPDAGRAPALRRQLREPGRGSRLRVGPARCD